MLNIPSCQTQPSLGAAMLRNPVQELPMLRSCHNSPQRSQHDSNSSQVQTKAQVQAQKTRSLPSFSRAIDKFMILFLESRLYPRMLCTFFLLIKGFPFGDVIKDHKVIWDETIAIFWRNEIFIRRSLSCAFNMTTQFTAKQMVNPTWTSHPSSLRRKYKRWFAFLLYYLTIILVCLSAMAILTLAFGFLHE